MALGSETSGCDLSLLRYPACCLPERKHRPLSCASVVGLGRRSPGVWNGGERVKAARSHTHRIPIACKQKGYSQRLYHNGDQVSTRSAIDDTAAGRDQRKSHSLALK